MSEFTDHLPAWLGCSFCVRHPVGKTSWTSRWSQMRPGGIMEAEHREAQRHPEVEEVQRQRSASDLYTVTPPSPPSPPGAGCQVIQPHRWRWHYPEPPRPPAPVGWLPSRSGHLSMDAGQSKCVLWKFTEGDGGHGGGWHTTFWTY